MKRIGFVAFSAVAVLLSGCELTATAYVEQRWVNDPHLKSPDGSAKAEIKVTRLIGRDRVRSEKK